VKPVEHPPPARQAPPKRATPHPEVAREAKPDQTAAPSAPASAPAPPVPASPPSPGAVAGWRSALVQKLQQAKRYPEAARARDEQGVATVRFTIERNGHIVSVNLVHSSGSETLDQEAVAMFRRAEPLPALPDGLGTNTLTLTVPVSFSLQ
jgi:protein TonB